MMKNSSTMIFFFSMILGTLITISSNSWLSTWMGLEINLLSFIPLMIQNNNLLSTEASLKYFLTQAFASSLLLFSMILFMMMKNTLFQFNLSFFSSLMLSSTLMIKSGIAPFHFWFPNVMEGISWNINLVLMTWQKIAPLMILSYFFIFNYYFFFIFLSVLIGSLAGINQTSLRKIMAYSSINHLGWMLTAMMFNEYLWLFYFLIYSIISISLIFMLNSFKLFYLSQMFNMFIYSHLFKFTMMMTFLSLSGLPPFLGFIPKWLVIQSLMLFNQSFLILFLILTSLITLYFYLRICYTGFMLIYSEMTWNFFMPYKQSIYNFSLIFMFFSIFSLFICINFMYNFY